MNLNLETKVYPNGVIEQEVRETMETSTRLITRSILDTKEKQVHEALVSLGWTPPNKSPSKSSRFWVKFRWPL